MKREDFPTRSAYAAAREKQHTNALLYQGFRSSYGSRSRASGLSSHHDRHGSLARRWGAVARMCDERGA